jgi:hypothetical protein
MLELQAAEALGALRTDRPRGGGAPDDIRARGWDRLTAWPSSC